MNKPDTCNVAGCNNPRYKTYTKCQQHRREYESERKRNRNARLRAMRAENAGVFTPLSNRPDLIAVEYVENARGESVIVGGVLYKPVRKLYPSEMRKTYGDSPRHAKLADGTLLFVAKKRIAKGGK